MSVDVMSVQQVAAKLGCKRTMVFQLIHRGVLEKAPRFGREIRIYSDSVDAALARPEAAERKSRKRKHLPEPVDVARLLAGAGL
jgi:excisionase family DNA binding protein